jgi:4-amino-4-deoxy-L-arabinose transferase-like glycosyltransferase
MRAPAAIVAAALFGIWCVGMLGRGYWTPDEPREADLAWRMSWQGDKAVPLLAGEAFCEKPPMTYWLAGASIKLFGSAAWAARLPNLLYAVLTALSVFVLARRAAGDVAGLAAAAAISTFLLSYQVAIWLATDAPLLAAVSVALLGQYIGWFASGSRERLTGYTLMHAALGLGFLCKSAAAWMVPALSFATLVIWERRWRELARWELYCGLLLQAALILTWIGFVRAGPDGAERLRVFFWNNLVGRVVRVEAPAEIQYAAAHRNSPGKYLLELPLYLWPWTLLVIAAARRAWQERKSPPDHNRAVRFALAVSLPSLALLSLAATARNIYLAPALPGAALLLGWWTAATVKRHDGWDLRALRATAILLGCAILVMAAAITLLGAAVGPTLGSALVPAAITAASLVLAGALTVHAWSALRHARILAAELALLAGYCLLLIGPASAAYAQIDRWQDLGALGRAVRADIGDQALVLFAPDETTRAWVDMFTRTTVLRVPGPMDAAAVMRLRTLLANTPHSRVLAQFPGRALTPRVLTLASRLGLEVSGEADAGVPPWVAAADLLVTQEFSLPNGRRYALLTRSD